MSEHNEPQDTQPEVTPVIKKILPAGDVLRSAITDKEVSESDFALPLFLGSLKEQHQAIWECATVYSQMVDFAQREANGEVIDLNNANSIRVKYNELSEKHFPGMEEETLGLMLVNYITFYRRGLDRVLAKDLFNDLLDTSSKSNTLEVMATRMGVVSPLKPSARKGANMSDRMRRSSLAVTGAPDTFAILLPNSRIRLKVRIPNSLELIQLINKIATGLSEFGSRYQVSSLNLERAAIARIIVEFILERAEEWSVSDILSSKELYQVISSADINTMAGSLLAISSPKGVNYQYTCLAERCNYMETKLTDVANMVIYDEARMPEVYRRQISEITNTGKKFTVEELLSSEVPYVDIDGKEIPDSIVFNQGRNKLFFGVPKLDQYFTCFDDAAARVNPELRQLAIDFPNAAKFSSKRKDVMAALRMVEYLQWFHRLEVKADPSTEGKDEVYERSEDSNEFDKGLTDLFHAGEDGYLAALEAVITKVPRMNYAFFGIPDDHCPHCKKDIDEGKREVHGGFTPIDPILSFFDHTQISIALRRRVANLQEETLS